MIEEHGRVVLLKPMPTAGLEPGDVGIVVHIYPNAAAYEVEFIALDGTTAAVLTVDAVSVRPVRPREMTHAREVSAA